MKFINNRIKKLHINCILFICIGFCVVAIPIQAQQVISLQQAIDKALQYNVNIQVKLLQEKQAAANIATATDIPKTIINTELGGINTSNFDTRLNIVQTFALPKVYKAQQTVFEKVLQQQQLQTILQKADIKRLVQIAYGEIQFLQMQQQVLQKIDSVYAQFTQKAKLRFSKGETNLLEKTTLENTAEQNKLQMQQTTIAIVKAKLNLAVLMNGNANFETSNVFNATNTLYDTALLAQHPYIKTIEQQVQIATQQVAAEKAKLLPDVSIGYSNQSIVGWQTNKDRTETYYNAANRFSIVQAGVAIPIFTKAQKARVEAAKQNTQVATLQVQALQQQFLLQVQQAKYNQLLQQQAIEYYNNSAIPQSETIIKNATLNYSNGAINYIEWGTLISHAFTIQLQHVQAVWQQYQAQVELAYLFQTN